MASVLRQRKKENQVSSPTSRLRRETGKQRQPVSSRWRPFFSESIQLNPVIGSPFSFPIQAKLAIGRPGDRYEQEADRIAEQVVQEVGSGKLRPIQPGRDEIPHRRPGSEVESGSTNTVQRQCTECEEKEKDKPQQTKPLAAEITPLLQRQDNNEEEAPPSPDEGRLQTKSEASGGGTAHPQSLFTQLQASHGHGRPLPAPARRQMERGFGADFGPVRIHTDETAARLSRSLHAHAFTYGQNIYFNRGQFQPETREGQRLLAHELVHVGQQNNYQQRAIQRSITGIIEEKGDLTPQKKLPSINEVVENFKKLVTPTNEDIIKEMVDNFIKLDIIDEASEMPYPKTFVMKGQFYWSTIIRSLLEKIFLSVIEKIKIDKKNSQPVLDWCPHKYYNDFFKILDPILYQIKGLYDEPELEIPTWKLKKRIRKVLKRIQMEKDEDVSEDKKNKLRKKLKIVNDQILKPSGKSGKDLYNELWKSLIEKGQIPDLYPYCSLSALRALRRYEMKRCYETVENVAKRYILGGGIPGLDRKKSTKYPKDKGFPFAKTFSTEIEVYENNKDGYSKGHVLIQKELSSAIPEMKDALDDGWILHARVLSGVDFKKGGIAEHFPTGKEPEHPRSCCKSPPRNCCRIPPEEHSVLIIGYTDNKFVFWDTDSYRSSEFGGGFGYLFFYKNDEGKERFSTAMNDDDLRVSIPKGDHVNGNHRYQVIKVWSK